MNSILIILFLTALAGLVHSYLLYPWLVRQLAKRKPIQTPPLHAYFPKLSIILPVHNEEKVIRAKVQSILGSRYPAHLIQIFIGSDASTDQTNAILTALAADETQISFFPYAERTGKPGVVNKLVSEAFKIKNQGADHILIITDASVMLESNTLMHLVRHFQLPGIALVDTNMMPTGVQEAGISRSEKTYISREVRLKYWESLAWKHMIGPFGGCYALQSDYFTPVPDRFLVDDFYIAMRVFEKGGHAINDPEAICREPVTHEIREEYRRKSRISAGNYQNLHTFRHLWWPPWKNSLAFAFFSHKVLRWWGPFFLLTMLLCSGILAFQGNLLFRYLFLLQIIGYLGLPLLDYLSKGLRLHILPLRSFLYFVWMNVALLEGFFKYLKGIKTNVWQPPKRSEI